MLFVWKLEDLGVLGSTGSQVLRDSASQLGNVDLLSLSKPNLVLDLHGGLEGSRLLN